MQYCVVIIYIIIIIIEKLNNLYSPNNVRVKKSRKMRWAGHFPFKKIPHIPLPEAISKYYPPIYAWVSQVFSFPQVSQPKPSIRLSFERRMSHAHCMLLPQSTNTHSHYALLTACCYLSLQTHTHTMHCSLHAVTSVYKHTLTLRTTHRLSTQHRSNQSPAM